MNHRTLFGRYKNTVLTSYISAFSRKRNKNSAQESTKTTNSADRTLKRCCLDVPRPPDMLI